MLARAFKQATTRFSSAPAARKLHTSRRAQAVPPVPTSADLAAKDAQLSSSAAYKAARAKFTVAATKASIQKTMQSLEEKGHIVDVVATKHDALKKIQHVIPKGASINLTGSTTLVRTTPNHFLPTLFIGPRLSTGTASKIVWTNSNPIFICISGRNWLC